MTRTIEELRRKAEQGSQQSQGEVFEVELEELLRGKFPMDAIEPVAKGELGADVIQQVNGSVGQPAGMILWESKRTKAWSDGWLAKLREDQRRCGADVALIISHALPKHIDHFDLVAGVWVAHPRCALAVAVALRESLIEISSLRLVQQGQQTKMEQVYEYLTGTRFRQRVDAVVEKFNDMREDLDKERKFMGRQWAKRETQIVAVIESTVGMVGDLQAIAGKAMPEITSLDTRCLKGQEKSRPNTTRPNGTRRRIPSPSPKETTLGLFLQNCEERKLSPRATAKMIIEQLQDVFPELTRASLQNTGAQTSSALVYQSR